MLSNPSKRNIFIILVVILGLSIIRYQIQLLSYLEWEDEVTHIVTSKLIASGKSLYSEIHELHGPLTFATGILIELLGNFGIKAHRIPIAILQWMAWLAIYFSPLLKNQSHPVRFTYTLICATISLIYFPDIFGHTYLFQVIAGLFLAIIISQHSFPSITEAKQSKIKIILGNALIASLPFLAFTYIPISIALFFASLTRQNIRISAYTAAITIALNLLFLASVGSFSGYLAMHYWINIAVSRQFIEGEALGFTYLLKSALSAITSDLSRFSVFLLICTSLTKLARYEKRFPWRALLISLGIASLLARSQGFQGLTLLYLSLSLPTILLYEAKPVKEYSHKNELFLMPIIAVCLVKILLLSPANISDRQIRSTSEFSNLVKQITEKNDRIISWPFQNYEYILSDRLPASGNFFYLPWQPEYYKNPKFGIAIDTCAEIKATKPKIMLISEYDFNGVKWIDYQPKCLDELLKIQYHRIPNTSYYVRGDIYQKYTKVINHIN